MICGYASVLRTSLLRFRLFLVNTIYGFPIVLNCDRNICMINFGRIYSPSLVAKKLPIV